MKLPIYFDYAATTPVDERVAEKMANYLTIDGIFGNPASNTHRYGWEARKAVEEARAQVADFVNAEPREIVWTSGATESDNLAIKGVAHFLRNKGKHIITCKTEHKAVLDTCNYMVNQGYDVTFLQTNKQGLVDLQELADSIRDDTILISIMHVNNEIGVCQDLQGIGEMARDRGVLYHVDAAQSAGKLPIDLQTLPVDLMSFSGHKIYGPKGIGALYVRSKPRVRLQAEIHGGGHEFGMRSGTLATHQIVGMGEAFATAKQELAEESIRITKQRLRLWQGINKLSDVYLNGDPDARVPGILNVSIDGVEGEALLMGLKDLAISSGSACTSASVEPSFVLKALGRSDALAHSSIRLTIGRYTTDEDVDFAIDTISKTVERLRQLSPLKTEK